MSNSIYSKEKIKISFKSLIIAIATLLFFANTGISNASTICEPIKAEAERRSDNSYNFLISKHSECLRLIGADKSTDLDIERMTFTGEVTAHAGQCRSLQIHMIDRKRNLALKKSCINGIEWAYSQGFYYPLCDHDSENPEDRLIGWCRS